MALTVSSPFRFLIRAKSDGALSIPNRVFVARNMLGLEVGRSPWMWGFGAATGKQHLWLNDTKRGKIICSAADHRGLVWVNYGPMSANQEYFSYDAKADVWENVCPSSNGPGTVVPCRPNDGQPWVHDTKRDRYWTLPGGWAAPGAGPHTHGATINITAAHNSNQGGVPYRGKDCIGGSTMWNGLMWMDPNSGLWTGITNANIGSPALGEGGTIAGSPLNAGIYDPVQDCIYAVGGAQDLVAYRIHLNDDPSIITHSFVTVPITALGPDRLVTSVKLQHPCFDVLGRKCYVMAVMAVASSGSPVGYRMLRFDMDNPAAPAELLAIPPFQTPIEDPAGTGGGCKVLFDTKNKRVLWPKHSSPEGVVSGMASYDPARDEWTEHQITVSPSNAGPPVGNSYVYDETHNCMIFGGSDGEIPQEQGYFYLWRYA